VNKMTALDGNQLSQPMIRNQMNMLVPVAVCNVDRCAARKEFNGLVAHHFPSSVKSSALQHVKSTDSVIEQQRAADVDGMRSLVGARPRHGGNFSKKSSCIVSRRAPFVAALP